MSVSISRFRYRFTPHWTMALLALFGFGLFCSLGVWQLKRAEGKCAILSQIEAAKSKAPIPWHGDESQSVSPYERVTLEGTPLPYVFFLDNQFHNHQLGYHVISPVLMNTGRVILVNRGFVKAGQTRAELPNILPLEKAFKLTGSVYIPPKKSWVLGAGIEVRSTKEAVIESYDFEIIAKFLHKGLYPFIIRLDNESPGGFIREWVNVVMPPKRHLGYAVQWFALALVVLIVFIALNLKKTED